MLLEDRATVCPSIRPTELAVRSNRARIAPLIEGSVWHATGNCLEYCNLQCTFTGEWLFAGLRCGCESGVKINVGEGRVLGEMGGIYGPTRAQGRRDRLESTPLIGPNGGGVWPEPSATRRLCGMKSRLLSPARPTAVSNRISEHQGLQ